MENNMTREEKLRNYEKIREKSTTGEPVRRNRERRIKMKYSDFKRCIKIIVASTSVVVAIITGAGMSIGAHAINNFQDKVVVNSMVEEFRINVINEETHRTADREHYFYDYSDIASKMEKNYDDFDEALYCLVSNIGEDQSDRVLNYTDYGSVEKYLETAGYEDLDEFKNEISKRIVLEKEVDEKTAEIEQMKAEHQTSSEEETTIQIQR
jgi:hypothetical protein